MMGQNGPTAEFACSPVTKEPGIKGWLSRRHTVQISLRDGNGHFHLPTRVRGGTAEDIQTNLPDIVRVLQLERRAQRSSKMKAQYLRDAALITRWHLFRKGIVVGKHGIEPGSIRDLVY